MTAIDDHVRQLEQDLRLMSSMPSASGMLSVHQRDLTAVLRELRTLRNQVGPTEHLKPHCRVVIFSAPRGTITLEQWKWARRHVPEENIAVCAGWPRCDMFANRNRMIRELVLAAPPHITEWVCMEHDITPLDASDRIFQGVTDVVGCRYPVKGNGAWSRPDVFHTGFWRAKREVFERLAPPWHVQPYSADGCDLLRCECSDLAGRMRQAGVTISWTGQAEHRSDNSWMHAPAPPGS